MSLQAGHKLAHYEILEPIGKGGMGEVYRAKDSKLGRDIAIKVLPDEFAQDEERLRRFQREAKVLASLNHPNIAAIYGLEQSGDTHYLVLELVPGETLAERISRGPIPVEEALDIAMKIAEALEEAHEHGIVHRDLKPANVKQTEDGKIKVLDFGLAKAFVEESAGSDAVASMSPTITRDATRIGVILGTAAYMSPEQAKGKRVDKRTDIFAFGALFYEILTGKRAFPGEDVSEVLASVIKIDPDLNALPEPARGLSRILEHCLAKDARQRLRDIGDVSLYLVDAIANAPAHEVESRRGGRGRVVMGVVALVAAGLLGWLAKGEHRSPDPDRVERFDMRIPSVNFGASASLAISPDGSAVAYAQGRGESVYLRRIDGWATTPVAESADGEDPFFSPDGRFVGFYSRGHLKRVRLSGGGAEVIAAADSRPRGAVWSEDNVIYFTQPAGLLKVPESGGEPETVLVLDETRGHRTYTWPEVLPGGGALLMTVEHNDRFDTFIYNVDTTEFRVLVEGVTNARYATSGHLIVSREGSLEAIPFDLADLEVVGPPRTVIENVAMVGGLTNGFGFSRDGMLVYAADQQIDRSLVFVDRDGTESPLDQEQASFGKGWLGEPSFSPDGQQLAVTNYNSREGRLCDTLLLDLRRGALTRLTFEGDNHRPIWTPDGQRITYTRIPSIYQQSADASRPAEIVFDMPEGLARARPESWSPDGATLLVQVLHPSTGYDILAVTADGESEAFVQTRFHEQFAKFSPDGKWLAYVSNETGRWEVYLRPFPGPGVKLPVSINGGTAPRWSRSGQEIFYRSAISNGRAQAYSMMVVGVELGSTPALGQPELLFEDRDYSGSVSQYDVAPDGDRFVMIKGRAGSAQSLHVVRNWLQEVKRLVPTDN